MQPSIHILLLADSDASTELLQALIPPAHRCRWHIAATGQPKIAQDWLTSIDAAVQQALDAIVIDDDCPEARTALAAIRQVFPALPIVLLTAREDVDWPETGTDQAVQEVLPKQDLSYGLLEKALSYAIDRMHDRRLRESYEQSLAQLLAKHQAQLQETQQLVQCEIDRHRKEALYQAIVETQTEIVIHAHADTTITFINEAGCRVLGVQRSEVMGKPWLNWISPVDRELTLQYLATLTPEQPSFKIEQKISLGSGEERWFEWVNTGIFLGQTLVDLLGIGRDITDRKLAEDALKQSELRYRQLFEANPHPMWVYDTETLRFLAVNDAAIAKYGYSKAEFLSMTLCDIRPAEDIPALLQNVQHITNGLDSAGIWRHRLKTGEMIFVEITSHTLNFAGRVAEMVLAHDVTARLHSEAALYRLNQQLETQVEQRTAALRESEERIRQIFEQSPVGIAITDLEGQITRVNASLSEILGYSRAELLTQSIQEVLRSERSQEPMPQLEQLLEHTLSVVSFERQPQRQDGKNLWINVNSALLFNALGRPMAILHLIENITDRKEAEAELIQVNSLQQAILDSTDYAIVSTDSQGLIQTFNTAAQELFGYSSEEVVGKVSPLIFHRPQELQEWEIQTGIVGTEPIAALIAFFEQTQQRKPLEQEWILQRKDGSQFPALLAVSPLFNQDNCVTGLLAITQDISRQKQAELEAQQLRDRLEFLLSSSPAVIYTLKPNEAFQPTFISKNIQSILGFERDRFLQDDGFWAGQIHLDDRPQFKHWLDRLQAQGQITYEYRFLHADGIYRWVRNELKLIWDAAGRPQEIIGYIADITDRKAAEEAVLNYAYEVEDLYNNAPCGYHSLDAECRFLKVNETELRLLGYTREEMIGKPLWQFLTPASYEAFQQNYAIFQQQGWVKDLEYDMICKDGSILPVMISATAVMDAQGNYLYNRATLFDIRDRRRAEELLKRQLAAMDATIDGVAILQNGRFVYINRAHVELFGYDSAEELLGQTWHCLYAPEEVQRYQQEVFPLLAQQHSWQGETIALRKDGNTFDEEISLTLTEAGDLICVCRDISERKRAEAALQQINERLTLTNTELYRATRLKDEFLASMSHELRTPLNAILGMAEGLQEESFGSLSGPQRSAIATIERSGSHLLDLINDILDLSKVEAGKLELQIEPVAVRYLCNSSLLFVKQQAHKKNIRLSLEMPPDLPDIAVDERRVRQALINLLTNAVKFTPEGGQVQLVVQGVQGDPPRLRCSVMDTGIGIDPIALPKLFQPFVQIDTSLSRRHSGTGLGLSLVRRLVELHGGRVSVTSQVNQGSCFSIELPYGVLPSANSDCDPTEISTPPKVSAKGVSPAVLSRDVPRSPQPDRSARILVVEDDEASLLTVSTYLTGRGFRILVARNGQEAIEQAVTHGPELILMDIQMPELDGLATIRHLRTVEALADIPIIALTALVMPGDRDACLSAGATDYMSKPVRLKLLQEKIQAMLNQHANL